MKKTILAIWLMCLALGVMAQEKKLTVTKVKKGDEPQAVMDALKQDFPKAITKDLSFLPSKLYGEEWNVQLEGDEINTPNFYQVSIKQGNRDYTAIYDKNGTLLSSKEVIRNSPLPPKVAATVKTFAGWHVDKVHEIIKYKGKTGDNFYRVKLQKGAEHKIVYLDRDGNIIDTRFALA